MTERSILFVGAGAVGQVYARHAQAGGARVGFYVKEKYAAEVEAGLRMLQFASRPGKSTPKEHTLSGAEVLTTPEQVAAGGWDVVMLCMSSTALRQPWLEPFLAALGADATLFVLQPGPRDQAYVAERFPRTRTVHGMIGFIAWQGPLEGEQWAGSGLAYWLPPGSPSMISGPADRVAPLVGLWARGGLKWKVVKDVGQTSAMPAVTLNCYLAALELEGWSFKQLKRSPRLKAATEAMGEACRGVGEEVGLEVPAGLKAVHTSFIFKLAMGLGPCVVPFPLETYLAYHFTKVGDQTRDNLKTYAKISASHGVATPALTALIGELEASDAASGATARG